MDELLASGALTDLTNPVDDIQTQLDQVSASSTVDNDLAALKAEIGAGTPAQLGPADTAPATKEPGEAPA
jgi:phage shock protein A